MSAETITGLGVSFPIMKLLKSDYYTIECNNPSHNYSDYRNDKTTEFEDTKVTGVQAAIKVRHIFDSGFVLGADFDIGKAALKMYGVKLDEKFTAMNLDLAIGYAIVNAERFQLIISAIAGLQHAKADLGFYYSESDGHYGETDHIIRFTAFEVGGELFANFKIGDMVGLFASCKLIGDIGNLRMDYPVSGGCHPRGSYHKTTAFVVKPSVGVSFTF